ncbi:MAG: OmpH family outer membrane protein [Alphaproteobacteria bacterium]|nr:OmpH family outer membrane protein [Alphaproteobacteria bacterium]
MSLNIKYTIFVVLSILMIFGGFKIYRHVEDNSHLRSFDIIRIGVLDGQKLKQEAKCFKSHEKISQMVSDLVSKIRVSEKEFKNSYNEIKKNSKLTLSAKNSELAKLESKWKSLSRKYNDEMQNIRNIDLKVTEITQTKLFEILESVAKSLKLNLILNKSSDDKLNIFYNSKDIDITDLIIKKMDSTLPTIKLEDLK